jgi:signal transduction histidine kinase
MQPSGEVRTVRERRFRVDDGSGKLRRHVGIVQDLTTARELEEELWQAQKMEAVGALASGVAHDFNNVLHVVMGLAYMGLSYDGDACKTRECLARISEVAERGGELARQLMGFARKRRTETKALAFDRAVQASEPLIERLVTEQIRVEVLTDASDGVVLADPVQVEQILMNLASNAKDAMPQGGVLTIETSTVVLDDATIERHSLQRAPRYVRLVVKDTGHGMDEATQARIFEPFFTTKEVGKGTGLGLSTVFAVTRQLGGYIDVVSAKGEGASFILEFPCVAGVAPAAMVRATSPGRMRGRVLLVEDNPLVRMTVRHYLEEAGLEVLEAADARDAKRLCATHAESIELLISDVVMPETPGPRLAAALRASLPELRVLFISANPEGRLPPEEAATGALLRKPFGPDELLGKVREVLAP